MSNKLLTVSVLLLLVASFSPALNAADETVTALMKRIDQQALQERRITDEQAERQHAIESGKQMEAMVHDLAPNQLVELARLCKQKMREIPSDSRHERYSHYFEEIIHFSIMRLGEQKTAAAKEALDQVHAIVTGAASLMETWDEAKEKQGK